MKSSFSCLDWLKQCLRRRRPNNWEREFTYLLAVPDAVIAVDGSGRIQLLNEAAEELTAVTPGLACGKYLDEVLRFHELDDGSVLIETVAMSRSIRPRVWVRTWMLQDSHCQIVGTVLVLAK